jgi:hypothetical protein
MIVLVVIVVVILVLGVISFLLIPASPTIDVTTINFSSADNICGLDGATGDGFNVSSGQSIQLVYNMTGNLTGQNATTGQNITSACTIHTLTTSTPGFSITAANVPLAIPANFTELLSFNVNTPSSSYTGPLTLVLT